MKGANVQLSNGHSRGSTPGYQLHLRPTQYTNAILISITLTFALTIWSTSHIHRRTLKLSIDHSSCSVSVDDPSTVGEESVLQLRHDPLYWLDAAEKDALQHGVRPSESCNAKLGRGFLQKFRNVSGTICGSEPGAASKVECYAYPVKNEGLACVASNLLVDGHLFMGKGPSMGSQEHNAYLPEGLPNSVELGCKMSSADVNKTGLIGNLQEEHLPWLKTASAHVDGDKILSHCHQAGVAIAHPVTFISRLDPTNPYHHMQSVVQTFLTLAVVRMSNMTSSRKGFQVLLADHFVEGPYIEIWRRLSFPYPVKPVSDMVSGQAATCFQNAILAHYALPNNAFLGYEGVGQEFDCPSTLLMAVSHWLRYLLMDSSVLPSLKPLSEPAALKRAEQLLAVPPGHQQLKVVFVSRSWFERGMLAGGGLTSWQQQRVMPPDTEHTVIKAIQDAVHQWNMQACVPPVFGWWQVPQAKPPSQGCKKTNVTFNFQVAELSLMDLYPDQAMMFRKTGVLVAAHGAALTNQIFMRSHRGAVVEIWHGNYHYVNQAHMLGHKHIRTSSDVNDLAAAVTQAMDHVASRY